MSVGYVKSFEELRVYQKAKEVSREIFIASREFPKEELYSLTNQIRRAARSVGAQIAEAWGKRRYERHFISKLTDADAEQLETQHWVGEALDCGYLSSAHAARLSSGLKEVGRMLNGMIDKADSFCHPHNGLLREFGTEYFIPDHPVTNA